MLFLFGIFFLASLAAGCLALLLRLLFPRDRRRAELMTRGIARGALRLTVRLAGLLRVFRVSAEGECPASCRGSSSRRTIRRSPTTWCSPRSFPRTWPASSLEGSLRASWGR